MTHDITINHVIILTHAIKLRKILTRQTTESLFFPNVPYASILKQPSSIRRPSNIPAYVALELDKLISQISESDLDLTQVDQALLETLETFCGSVSVNSKLADGRIKESFVSDYVFN